MAKNTEQLTLEELHLCQRCIHFILAHPALREMMFESSSSRNSKGAQLADLEKKIIDFLKVGF